jgi:transcriptional regulator with XRE-family HTH domain
MVLKVRGRQGRDSDNSSMAASDPKLVFGKRLRALRELRGWSQEHLAAVVGLDRSYVGSVERGERNISLENIHKLAKALKISPASFFDSFRK